MRSPQISRSERTRRAILARAVDLASVEGLEGLTVGRLAGALSLSKSGLFAHFGSKEELQLAVVDAAKEIFEGEALGQADEAAPGLPRLLHLGRAWLGYVEKAPFRGGCFFAAVSPEVDDRPGRVRDLVAKLTRQWVNRLETEACAAIEAGDLETDADPGQVAFEIHAFVQEANWAFQLHGDTGAFRRAAIAIHRTLATVVTDRGLRVLAEQEAAI
jgi:AcrR family transcriptional regulator